MTGANDKITVPLTARQIAECLEGLTALRERDDRMVRVRGPRDRGTSQARTAARHRLEVALFDLRSRL